MKAQFLCIHTLISVFIPAQSNPESVYLDQSNYKNIPKKFDKLNSRRNFTKISRRIIGGSNVSSIEEFPYMVFIRKFIEEEDEDWCTGTVLSKKYVMTAAHCLISCSDFKHDYIALGYKMEIYIGGTTPNQALLSKPKQTFIHPKFTCNDTKHQCESNYDMGIVELRSKLKFNKRISKVKLPPPHFLDGLNSNLENCQVIGWGITLIERDKGLSSYHERPLMGLKVNLIDNTNCIFHLKISNENGSNYKDKGLCKATHICTIEENKGFCRGDSGGPLICNGLQVGIASLTVNDDCVGPHMIDIYTRVDINIKWIKKSIRKVRNRSKVTSVSLQTRQDLLEKINSY